jgi:hypothetical protein
MSPAPDEAPAPGATPERLRAELDALDDELRRTALDGAGAMAALWVAAMVCSTGTLLVISSGRGLIRTGPTGRAVGLALLALGLASAAGVWLSTRASAKARQKQRGERLARRKELAAALEARSPAEAP